MVVVSPGMIGAPPQVATQRLPPGFEDSACAAALCAPAVDIPSVARRKAIPAHQNFAPPVLVCIECLIAVSFCEMRRVCEARPGAGRTTCRQFDTTSDPPRNRDACIKLLLSRRPRELRRNLERGREHQRRRLRHEAIRLAEAQLCKRAAAPAVDVLVVADRAGGLP